MAMILCPECGQEISDKAKKCIHCGKVMIEEVQPQKFCAECGKEIPIDAQECPFCGCPVEPEKPENVAVSQINEKVKKNKKSIILYICNVDFAAEKSLPIAFGGKFRECFSQLLV